MSTGFFNSAESVITYTEMAAEIILLMRLARLGLIREFKIFWIFLVYDVVRTIALSAWNYHSASYEWMWIVTAPVWTILVAGVSLELLCGLAQPIPRDKINRAVALYGFLIGMTISVGACMLLHPQAVFRPAALLTIIAKGCVSSGCILAILAQGAFLAFGIPLIGNWRRHRRILLVFLAALIIGSYATLLKNQQYAEWLMLLQSVCLLACYCAWIPIFERAWSHLRFFPASQSGFQEISPSEETLAEIFAYRAREARSAPAEPAPRGA